MMATASSPWTVVATFPTFRTPLATTADLDAVVARHGDVGARTRGRRAERHPTCNSPSRRRRVTSGASMRWSRARGCSRPARPIWEIDDAAWDAVWSVNVLGTRRLIEAAAPTLIANGKDAHGRESWPVASAAGHTGLYHLAAYSARSTRSSDSFVASRWTWRPTASPRTAVSPGSTRTAILEASARVYELSSGEEFAQHQPIGRLIEPSRSRRDDPWLCSPASSAITGADFAVDGGMTVG